MPTKEARMSLIWGKQQPTSGGWYALTVPDRFSITFNSARGRYVLGEQVSNGRYTDSVVVAGFDSLEEAQAEAERIAGAES